MTGSGACPQSSLDRGFGRCSVLRAQKAVLKRYANKLADRVVRPAGTAGPGGRARAKERALDFDGIAAVGHSIRSGAAPPPPLPLALWRSPPHRTRPLDCLRLRW